MMRFRHAMLLGLVLVSACAIPADTSKIIREDKTVQAARQMMIGMNEADVRMCAGFPTSGAKISDTEKIWTYQRSYSRGNLNVGVTSVAVGPMPGITGATGVGAEGFCNTQIRFVNGRVVQVEFAGDNNTSTRLNGLCVSTIDACVAYAQRREALRQPKP